MTTAEYVNDWVIKNIQYGRHYGLNDFIWWLRNHKHIQVFGKQLAIAKNGKIVLCLDIDHYHQCRYYYVTIVEHVKTNCILLQWSIFNQYDKWKKEEDKRKKKLQAKKDKQKREEEKAKEKEEQEKMEKFSKLQIIIISKLA